MDTEIDVTARQLRVLLDSAIGSDHSIFLSYLTHYMLDDSSLDTLTKARVDFMRHLRSELRKYSPLMLMHYLRDDIVRERCLHGFPPSKEEHFLQARSDADLQLLSAARRDDARAAHTAFAQGGRNYRSPWYLIDTAVHIASTTGNPDLLQVILHHEPSAVDQISLESFHRSPLHLAVLGGHGEAAALLIRHHAALEISDLTLRTPMHLAFESLLPHDHCLTNTLAFQTRVADPRPLIDSAMELPPLFRLLLDAGADINAVGAEDGLTCLHWACMNGLRTAARLLIARGADKNAASCHGFTPLHVAALSLNHVIVIDLLSFGVQLDVHANGFGSALNIAAGASAHSSATRPLDFAYRKRKCTEALESSHMTMNVRPRFAMLLLETGQWNESSYPFVRCFPYLRMDTHVSIMLWAKERYVDEAALYHALYSGSGFVSDHEIVRLRCLCGPTAVHHGLRNIRRRLLLYSVSFLRRTRLLARDIRRRLPHANEVGYS